MARKKPTPAPVAFKTIDRETLDTVTGGRAGLVHPSQMLSRAAGYTNGVSQPSFHLQLGGQHAPVVGKAGLGGLVGGAKK